MYVCTTLHVCMLHAWSFIKIIYKDSFNLCPQDDATCRFSFVLAPSITSKYCSHYAIYSIRNSDVILLCVLKICPLKRLLVSFALKLSEPRASHASLTPTLEIRCISDNATLIHHGPVGLDKSISWKRSRRPPFVFSSPALHSIVSFLKVSVVRTTSSKHKCLVE